MSLCHTEDTARAHAEAVGWDDDSLILLLCRFIESRELTDAMSDYLRAQAALEEAQDEDTGAEGL